MRITIAERLRPFSHFPGTSFVLPGSHFGLQIFPTFLRVSDLSSQCPVIVAEMTFALDGPMEGFTALQDLENGSLRVFGESMHGYFRYSIKAINEGQGIAVSVEKAPDAIAIQCAGTWISNRHSPIQAGQTIIFSHSPLSGEIRPCSFLSLERLSLGSHKKQDWELVLRRLSFTELFPIWFRLGQMVQNPVSRELGGVSLLLNDCREAIKRNAPEKILTEFKKVFLAGFEGVLLPRLNDTYFQGIHYPDFTFQTESSPLILLVEGAKLIRSLFIQESENTIHVLPSLPPEFHCGRLIEVQCVAQGSLSLEWTKKTLRLMTFSALENQKVSFSFSNHEKKCRLRCSNKDKGIVYTPGTQLDVIAGQNYWFDHFER